MARMIRADEQFSAGEFAKAVEVYRALLRKSPNSWVLMEKLAMALERSGGQAEALQLYKKVWDIARSATSANNAAYLVSQLHPEDPEQLSAAVVRVDAAIGQVGRVPVFLDTKGWLLYLQGKVETALPLVREAVVGASGSAEVHYHLAVIEEAMGHTDSARMHYQATVDIVSATRKRGGVVEPASDRAARLASEALKTEKKDAA
jgi:Flp pilus assembly protein TadD